MFGVTEAGNSVMAHIHQFLSYMYVEIDHEFQGESIAEADLTDLKNRINNAMQN